jgi:molybdopterin converting factor small subunit
MTRGPAVKVVIPTPLRSYTGRREVEASGPTLAAVLAGLDPSDVVVIVPALSGG